MSSTLEDRIEATVPNQVTDPNVELLLRAGRRRRRVKRAAAAGSSALAAVAVVTALTGLPSRAPTVDPLAPADGGSATTPMTSQGSGVLPQSFLERTDVAVFLCTGDRCPAPTHAEVVRLGEALRSDPDVAEVGYESSEAGYERFAEQFADQSELVESVDPDALPSAFRLVLVDGADPQEVAVRYESLEGVEAVVDLRAAVSDTP